MNSIKEQKIKINQEIKDPNGDRYIVHDFKELKPNFQVIVKNLKTKQLYSFSNGVLLNWIEQEKISKMSEKEKKKFELQKKIRKIKWRVERLENAIEHDVNTDVLEKEIKLIGSILNSIKNLKFWK